jgi:hypothetical protein
MANPHQQLPVFPGFLPGNFPGFPGSFPGLFPGAQALMAGFPTVPSLPSPLFGAAGAYGFIPPPGTATLCSQFPEHLAASVFGPPMELSISGRNPAKNKNPGNKKRKAVGAGRKGEAPKRKQR